MTSLLLSTLVPYKEMLYEDFGVSTSACVNNWERLPLGEVEL